MAATDDGIEMFAAPFRRWQAGWKERQGGHWVECMQLMIPSQVSPTVRDRSEECFAGLDWN